MAEFFPKVSVNGATIPTAAIIAEAQNHPAPKGKPEVAWTQAARALAIRALLLQEAQDRALAATPKDLGRGRRETPEEALIRVLLEAEVRPDAPSPMAVRAAYDAAPERYKAPTLYEAAHILFAAPPDDVLARTKALGRANAILGVLATRPDAFSEIAAAESDCPSREAGGRLGQMTTGDTVPEFEAALLGLELGHVSPAPVTTRYGVHLLRLDALAEGAVLPFETVRIDIETALEKAAWADAARAFVDRLARNAEIEGVALREAA